MQHVTCIQILLYLLNTSPNRKSLTTDYTKTDRDQHAEEIRISSEWSLINPAYTREDDGSSAKDTVTVCSIFGRRLKRAPIRGQVSMNHHFRLFDVVTGRGQVCLWISIRHRIVRTLLLLRGSYGISRNRVGEACGKIGWANGGQTAQRSDRINFCCYFLSSLFDPQA